MGSVHDGKGSGDSGNDARSLVKYSGKPPWERTYTYVNVSARFILWKVGSIGGELKRRRAGDAPAKSFGRSIGLLRIPLVSLGIYRR